MPKLKFVYTKTDQIDEPQIFSPLQTRSNPPFSLNALKGPLQVKCDGLKALPSRTRVIAQALGLSSSHIFAKLRAKEIADQVSIEIDDEANKIETVDAECQTAPLECNDCVVRSRRTFLNKGIQTYESKKDSTATQTDEEEFIQPLARLMARLSSSQLAAVQDFAGIVLGPRAQSSADMNTLREQLVDAYKLAYPRDNYRGASDHGDGRFSSNFFNAGQNNFLDLNAANRNFNNIPMSRDMDDFDRGGQGGNSNSGSGIGGGGSGGGGGGGSNSRQPADFDMRNIDDNFRRDSNYQGNFETEQRRKLELQREMELRREVELRRDLELRREIERRREIELRDEERRVVDERNRFMDPDEVQRRLMEEEHIRQQELILHEREEMERLAREEDVRFQKDTRDFNSRESPERQGRSGPFNKNQWMTNRGEPSRRSRGAWKSAQRGRGGRGGRI